MQIPDEVRLGILDFAYELDGERLHGGSWIECQPSLRSVIVTQQVLLLLTSIESDLFPLSVDEGVRWLCSAEIVDAQGVQWRPLPLICAGASPSEIDSAVALTRNHVINNVRPDPNSPLDAFYVDVCARRGDLDQYALGILDQWAEQLSEIGTGTTNGLGGPPSWKPNMLTHTLVALTRADRFNEASANAILALVDDAAARPSPRRVYWENLNMTAYTALNLVHFRQLRQSEPVTSADSTADRLIEGAVGYVVQRWQRGDFRSGSIAGGGPDLVNTPFQKIVCARLITDTLTLVEPGWAVEALAKRNGRGDNGATPTRTDEPVDGRLFVGLTLLSAFAGGWQLIAGSIWLGCGLIAATIVAAIRHERFWRWPPKVSELLVAAGAGVVVALAIVGLETLFHIGGY